LVGGLDVGIGVFGLFLVVQATDSRVLGALAFVIGFVAILLARSEVGGFRRGQGFGEVPEHLGLLACRIH
jgi:hypothetical protein